MTPLPAALGGGSAEIVGWSLQDARYAEDWASGIGAFTVGGRWNSIGRHVVYAAVDPSTAILEVAVHKGFKVLNTVKHLLHRFSVTDPAQIRVVQPAEVPNPNWLRPITPRRDQQEFGDALLAEHPFVLIPSAVSPQSWNLLVNAATARPWIESPVAELFALDPRLRRV